MVTVGQIAQKLSGLRDYIADTELSIVEDIRSVMHQQLDPENEFIFVKEHIACHVFCKRGFVVKVVGWLYNEGEEALQIIVDNNNEPEMWDLDEFDLNALLCIVIHYRSKTT